MSLTDPPWLPPYPRTGDTVKAWDKAHARAPAEAPHPCHPRTGDTLKAWDKAHARAPAEAPHPCHPRTGDTVKAWDKAHARAPAEAPHPCHPQNRCVMKTFQLNEATKFTQLKYQFAMDLNKFHVSLPGILNP